MNVRATRFPLFDSLRAMAALAILGTHAGVQAHLYQGGSRLGHYAARLEVGIAIFFLISGFLLYRPFVRARLNDHPQPHTGAYAWRRFLRIVPAYWVALTVVALWLGLPGVFTESGIPTYYGFAQIYRGVEGGLVQAWTLCIEVSFYAFLPVYAALLRAVPARSARARLTTEWSALLFLFAGSIVYKLAVLAAGNPREVNVTPALAALPTWLDQFALGMGLAVLSVWLERRESLPRWLTPLDRFPGLAWAGAAVAFWAVSTQIGFTARFFEPATSTQYMERHLLFALVALGVIVPAVVGDQTRGLVRRLLGHRVPLYLGLISYAIYLYGGAVLDQLGRWNLASLIDRVPSETGRFALWAVLGAVGTIAIATVSYYVLERPALSLKRLVGPREPAPGEALAEPAAVSAPPARAG